tara:strand:- start:6210 stop:6818 length:609 start_codon:yes stop_codon:yes gene_type:complete
MDLFATQAAPVKEKTETQIVEVVDNEPVQVEKDDSLLWNFSGIIAQSIRLSQLGDNAHEQAIARFCQEISQLDNQLQSLDFSESKMIQFMIRDWVMELFSQTRSSKLIAMQNILIRTDISGFTAGRDRTVQDILLFPHRYPNAEKLLSIIAKVSPYYHPALAKNICRATPAKQAKAMLQSVDYWLLVLLSTGAIIGGSFFLL